MNGFLLLAAFTFHIPVISAKVIYHVDPTNGTQCPGLPQPCLALNQYVEKAKDYFIPGADVAMHFLPGAHSLCGALRVTGLESVTMMGSVIDKNGPLIYCIPSCGGGIEFDNVSYIRIAGLNFLSCGIAEESITLPALLMFEVPNALFENVRFKSNRYAGALWIFYSNATFKGNTSFADNEDYVAGAIYGVSSHLSFKGTQVFENNSASSGSGGAIVLYSFSISFAGKTVFMRNQAGKDGGALYISDATFEVTGYLSFMYNHAEFGGAGAMENSSVAVKGCSSFMYNSALHNGGVFFVVTSSLHFDGNQQDQHGVNYSLFSSSTIAFQNNLAGGSGGALALTDLSTLTLNGSVLLKGNSARQVGGALVLFDSPRIEVMGRITFIDNHVDISFNRVTNFLRRDANVNKGNHDVQKRNISNVTAQRVSPIFAFSGGAFYAKYSQIILKGTSAFKHNSGDDLGGAIALNSCSITVTGNVEIIGNRAFTKGGGIFMTLTTMHLTGYVNFTDNSAGLQGGGANIEESNATFNGYCSFTGNIAEYSGGAVFTEEGSMLSFTGNTTFVNNSCTGTSKFHSGGALHIYTGTLTVKGFTLFRENSAQSEGGAICIRTADAAFIGNTTFIANGVASGMRVKSGGAIQASDSYLSFSGVSTFYQNQADLGGAMKVSNTILLLLNETVFFDNFASSRGGGLLFVRQNRTRQMCLGADAVVSFVNNDAERGGAIAVIDFFTDLCFYQLSDRQADTCFLQPNDLDLQNSKVQLKFINNSATDAGRDVYGGLFDRCGLFYKSNQFKRRPDNGVFFFLRTTSLSENEDGHVSRIASDPFEVRLCINETLSAIKEVSVSVRRGQTFNVSIAAVGESDVIVPVTLRANFPTHTGQNAVLGEGEAIQAGGRTCTNVHYSVRSPMDSEQLNIYPEGPCRDISGLVKVKITFLPCPDGFNLSYSECICELRLQKYTNTCSTNDETILRKGDFWISPVYDNGTYGGLIIHPHCPFDYCRNEPVRINLQVTDTQCASDRSGILCGKCRSGLSLVLGSTRCLDCSNSFIPLFLLFALAGIVLVCFLLSLRLTVSVGTINGLVFYANVLAINKAIFFPPNDYSVLSVFIAWVNLDLGIEACFFEKLDAYSKIWLQFVFPAYVWTLVILMIVGSYYSTLLCRLLGRNPVAVLATLFLLSFTKILRTIIAIFSFTYLEYPDGTMAAVWLHDGNIFISDPRYVPLLLAATFTLLFLFLPYMVILIVSQWIQRKSELRIFRWINSPKVKAFLDAYHAPYKIKYRYWTGMLLLLRCALYLVFSFNTLGDPSVNLLAITTSVFGLAILMRFTGSVYCRWYLDVLDASFLLNLGVLAAATYHNRLAGGSQIAAVYTSATVAVMTFVGIVIYHSYLQLKDRDTTKYLFNKIRRCCTKHTDCNVTGGIVERACVQDLRACVPVTFIELRESLLTNS